MPQRVAAALMRREAIAIRERAAHVRNDAVAMRGRLRAMRERNNAMWTTLQAQRATPGEGCPMSTASRQAEITNALGFHLRAAGKFVQLAQQFQAEVRVTCNDRKANGKSVIDLTTLAAPCGSRLDLDADGPDADAALDALTGLIGRGFDEES